MNLGIKGKKALVTGAGRGLGESIALNLAKEGVKVTVISRTKSDLVALLERMGGEKEGHYFYECDLAREGSLEKAVKIIERNFGHPDILVNNVGGTMDITDPFCTIADWRKVWRINMEVAVELNRLVIPYMRKKRWGRIVNISSISSMENQGPVPYCSVKAALSAYSRSMGRVLAPEGIIMTAILPGAVFTKGGYWDKISKKNPEHVRKYLTERMAIQRFGKPDEIGEMVTILCSEVASFCVGSVVTVDGGQGRSFFS